MKIVAIKELLDEIGGPALICYEFEADKQRLLKAIKGSVLFDGTRKQIEAFAAGNIQHLILHPGSAGHGVDQLQDGTDTLVFFGIGWSLENHAQVIERIGPTRQLQSGHPRPVFIHYIAAQNTIDEVVMQRLIHKQSVQEVLMDAVKRRDHLFNPVPRAVVKYFLPLQADVCIVSALEANTKARKMMITSTEPTQLLDFQDPLIILVEGATSRWQQAQARNDPCTWRALGVYLFNCAGVLAKEDLQGIADNHDTLAAVAMQHAHDLHPRRAIKTSSRNLLQVQAYNPNPRTRS